MIIQCPKYLRTPNAKSIFRRAVLHRILADNNPNVSRGNRHFYFAGWYNGILQGNNNSGFAETIAKDIYAEVKRVYRLLGEPNE